MVEDPAEEARTVESWNAKPVDRAVARDERRPTTVPDQPVVLERKVGLLPHFGRRFSKHSYAAFVGAYNATFAAALLCARIAGRTLPTPSLGDIALFGVATHKLSRLL